MSATPEQIASAWGAWRVRHKGSMGPGPGFVEAIDAALAASPDPRITALEKENAELLKALEFIRDYPPAGGRRTEDGYPLEVVYDEFAYRRIVDSYRFAASLHLRKGAGNDSP